MGEEGEEGEEEKEKGNEVTHLLQSVCGVSKSF